MSSLLPWNGAPEETHTSQDMTTCRTAPSDPVSINASSSAHPGCINLQLLAFVPWNNPDNVISFQVEELVLRLKDVVFLPLLFLIGGPANVVNMAVFYKQGLSVRINVCLFALSLVDELYLVFSMMLYGDQLYLQFTTKER